ncbi:MAG: PAS domain S-box protein [Scytonema sp. PMC 1069.18]|nr:PAS domain S-box protein [Scytonema sp. PMC 1069.18]MEC4887957.1 PAS domain S-box protein [Scytonema sp. PMC 1070.18]
MFSSTVQWQQEQSILEFLAALSYRSGNLNTYLHEIVCGVSRILKSDWSIVTVCHDNRGKVVASNLDLGNDDNGFSLHETLVDQVTRTRKYFVIEDARLHISSLKPPEGYLCYLGIPLETLNGECKGTICSFFHQPRSFTVEVIKIVNIFAKLAATAIDNYQLYQQQQQFNQLLEVEVQTRTKNLQALQAQLLAMNNQLELRIQQRTIELQRANEQLQAEIRERQQVEKALRQSEARFKTLVDNAGDAFLLIDPVDNRIVDVNRRACEYLGYSHEELVSLSIHKIDIKLTAKQLAEFRYQLVTGVPSQLESVYQRKDGSTFPIEANICLFESGEQQRELALVRDISDRQQAEQAQARLAEIGELAAMIVHEVRNPLTTVLLGLTSFKNMELPEPSQRRLALALEEAERLKNLLNEILLYTKRPILHSSKLEVNHLIAEILEQIRYIPFATNRRFEFVSSFPSFWILGDRDKLKQVFINLLKNACEAVNDGEVITWRVSPDKTQNQVCISIHNGGEPIPPHILTKLGTPFFTTKPSGNGLGLAIVKQIVEAHQGKLTILSTPEEGTTANILLPLV